jgi:hypothetical protein
MAVLNMKKAKTTQASAVYQSSKLNGKTSEFSGTGQIKSKKNEFKQPRLRTRNPFINLSG